MHRAYIVLASIYGGVAREFRLWDHCAGQVDHLRVGFELCEHLLSEHQADMYDSEDDYDSDEEPEFLSSEEEMEFLTDQQHDTSLSPKTEQSVWGVIDKAKLAKVQVRKDLQTLTLATAVLAAASHLILGIKFAE